MYSQKDYKEILCFDGVVCQQAEDYIEERKEFLREKNSIAIERLVYLSGKNKMRFLKLNKTSDHQSLKMLYSILKEKYYVDI